MEQKQLGRGCCCCRDFLLVSRETGGYYAVAPQNIEKFSKFFWKIFLDMI